MFTFVIILAIASTALELMIAAKIPVWRRNAHKFKLVNLGLSVVLSFIIGILFGAAGLIAMTAAILSTILSIPGYAVLHWAYDSPEAQAHGGNMFAHYKQSWTDMKLKWGQTLRDFATVIYKTLRIITFPIWGTRALINKFRALKVRFARP
jgi:hypothetical protein